MEKVGNMQENMGHVSRGFLLKNTLRIDIKNINFKCNIELGKNCSTQFEIIMNIIKMMKIMFIALTN